MPPVRSSSIEVVPQGMPDPYNTNRGATPQEIAYTAKIMASQARLKLMPKMTVTIVNLNPYPLMVLHPLFDGVVVKANKEGDEYSALTISDVRYQVDQGVDRNHTPQEFWPIELANEFSTQYAQKGGVFHINGDLERNPELAFTAEFRRLFTKAEEDMVLYCRKLKASADAEWNSPNHQNARNIHPPHRQAARILFARKLIDKLPEWMSGDVLQGDVTVDCPACKLNTRKGQLVCTCGFVLDPFNAFKQNTIGEDNIVLERLTRAQVQELGVSAYVAETADERPARLAAGLGKPLSQFEINQQIALDKAMKAKVGE